jgi:hypothetical protein
LQSEIELLKNLNVRCLRGVVLSCRAPARPPETRLSRLTARIDASLQHPNIVKYKGYVKSQHYLHIVLECVLPFRRRAVCDRLELLRAHPLTRSASLA